MKTRPLGSTALQVSQICLGTMMFGDRTELAEAAEIVAHARDHGVNFIDTADVYGKGASETMVGTLIAPHRDHWLLATKIGNRMNSDEECGYARHWMLAECEASLKRLATDRIDLYYLHRDYLGLDLEEPLRAIETLIKDGKIRHWGLSNFRAFRIAEAVHMARAMGIPAPVACQPYYNLLNRAPEVEVLPACAHYGLGVVPYSPVARGVLTAKYRPGEKPSGESRGARVDKRFMETEFRAESLIVAQQVKAHCEQTGRSPVHFACAWVLRHRAVSSVIAGPRTFAQWREYVDAPECAFSDGDEAFVNQRVAPGHPSTPGYSDPLYPWESLRD
ncbi:MAG TPA: aldo/keto reductase [Usitatibacteraceae bacterium]|nr:aldo/keto reductase [Usitatibacteraceae bacterium]